MSELQDEEGIRYRMGENAYWSAKEEQAKEAAIEAAETARQVLVGPAGDPVSRLREALRILTPPLEALQEARNE